MQQICVPPRIQRTSVRHRQNIFFLRDLRTGMIIRLVKISGWRQFFHLGKYLPGYGLMIYEYVPRWLMNMVCISPYMLVIFHHLWFDDIWIITVKNNCHNSVDYSEDDSPCSEFMNIYWISICPISIIKDMPHGIFFPHRPWWHPPGSRACGTSSRCHPQGESSSAIGPRRASRNMRSCIPLKAMGLPGLVNIQKANWKPWPSRNSGFIHEKWWFSIVM